MANVTLLRFAGGMSLSKVFGPHKMSRMTPLTNAMIQKKSLMLTPTSQARIYGPEATQPEYSSHWKTERVLAVALLPITPAAVMFPNAAFDFLLSAAMVVHTHWGLAGVSTDYIHGESLKKVVNPLILMASILAFGGLCYLNINDIGFGNAVRMLYSQL